MVSDGRLNLLERRLLSVGDKKWFDRFGQLDLVENPNSELSLRPNNMKLRGRETVVYSPATTYTECTEIVVKEDDILEMHLSQLKFSHHPLFSIEHVVAQKLTDLYEEYSRSIDSGGLEKIHSQLENLRSRRRGMIKLKAQSGDSDSADILDTDKEIKKLRKTYFEEGRRQRNNLISILETWKQIKKIRENQKYSNTNIKLIIKKEKVETEEAKEAFEKTFEETLEEVVREEEAKQRLRMQSRKKEEEKEETDKADVEETSLSYDIDEEKLRQDLMKKFEASFPAAGEPTVKLALSEDHKITDPKSVHNHKETARRSAVSSTKLFLKIFCNKIQVCRSKSTALNDDFSADIDETFSIQLVNIPKYFQIEVYEQPKGLIRKKICSFNLNLPSQNICVRRGRLHKKFFENTDLVHYKHEGVGSGLKLKDVSDRELKTKGHLEYYLGWDKVIKRARDSVCFDTQFTLANELTDKNLAVNSENLLGFLEQNVLVEGIGETVDEYKDYLSRAEGGYFRLNPHQTQFCRLSIIEENLRLNILQLRDQNEIEFEGAAVPNRLKEIPANALTQFRRRKAAEDGNPPSETEPEDERDGRRSMGKKYLRLVHARVFQRCKNLDNNLTYESVVDEKYLVYFETLIRTLLRNFLNWFRWQPRICKPYPTPYDSSDAKKEDLKMTQQPKIIVKVISGKNIPSRTKKTFSEGRGDSETDAGENDVEPFVEVCYKNICARTSRAKGEHPTWNETVMLPLETEHADYLNPGALNGTITVSVFDDSDMEVKKMGKNRINWLGGLDISLSAVCCTDSMKGMFKVRLPQLLLGYETEVEKHRVKSPKVSASTQNYSHHTYLYMEVSVEPNIPKLTPSMDELPCGDVPFIHDHIVRWNQTYNDGHPGRKFSALALDTNAKTTCVTRFVRPLETPQINTEELEVSSEQCLRFVSLIPFTECNRFYQNVWLTTDQLLNLMIGTITDHATALTCYFLALKMDAWLLLGYGIPHGSAAYVLVREYVLENDISMYYVYDVVYGERYNVLDVYCPLQSIYCLINGDNIWANTQRSDSINLTRFDLTRRSDWLPLFNNNITAPTNFINNKVNYKRRATTETLEITLERKIRKQVSKLRQLDRTIWNLGLGNMFKDVLRSFEMNCMYGKGHCDSVVEINDKINSYKVSGYAINTAYTTMSKLVKSIKSSGIYIQEESITEFVNAVYIQSYSGQLLSVWIFIGTVKARDS